MYFVNQRWLGGTLTNFVTIQKSIGRFKELTALVEGGGSDLTKKELSRLDKERKKLEKNLSGIQEMQRLPDAIFVVDAGREQIAVHEARKLGIPVIAIVDTNCDPDVVDFVIPGNDDALRAIKLFTSRIAEAVISGKDMVKAASEGPSGNGGPHRDIEGEAEVKPANGDVAGGAPPEAPPLPA
jgi:small subunit ribosomal protein S2